MNTNPKTLQERCQNLERMTNQAPEILKGLKNVRTTIESCVAERVHQINESYYKIGLVSKAFTNAQIMDFKYYSENAQTSAIRETTHEDVTSEYFIRWFFEDEDWVGVSPREFNFKMITHCENKHVYGYFNGDKIDGIIRVDDEVDNYMLSFLITNSALHNQGIGQSLLQYIFQKFADKKITLHVYTDNEKAIYIYKKYGFEIVDTEYGSGPHPSALHHVMQRDVQ